MDKVDKGTQVKNMFDEIAGSYDLLNHLLSFNIDKSWRRKAIRSLGVQAPAEILDVATGTGDLAIEAVSRLHIQVTGVDVSQEMLNVAQRKILKKNYDQQIKLVQAPAEQLPFNDPAFDAAMVAFGVRNFSDPLQGLKEIFRVLKPGAKLAILEFTLPPNPLIRSIYRFYFHRILPAIGKIISKNLGAYRYLPESVEAFDKGEAFLQLMKEAGFDDNRAEYLTFGVCALYTGTKK